MKIYYALPTFKSSSLLRGLQLKTCKQWLTLSLLFLLAVLSGACSQSNREEQARMQKEIDELKEGQRQVQEQIKQLKGDQLLKRVSPAKSQTPFDIDIDKSSPEFKGNERARVAIIEFSDFQCSYCLSYVNQTFPQLDKDYIQSGKVKYFFRNLPLTSAHPNAFRAAEAAHCAAEQGKFWQAHDRFFANQDALNPNDWLPHARALGLEIPKFDECLRSGRFDEGIKKDIEEAQSLGIEGTPAFLIGVVAPNGQTVSVRRVMLGAEPYDSFKQALDELLSSRGK
jgi:protein-disulfide isomerase